MLEKMGQRRLSVLKLADELSSVSEACRRTGMDRTSFYRWKKRYQKNGLEGLENRPTIHKSHPHTTPPKIVNEVLMLSLENPDWGCVKLSSCLKDLGISISSPTVQKILIKHGMASMQVRLSNWQNKFKKEDIKPTREQINLLALIDPYYREYCYRSDRPGKLAQDFFCICELEKGEKLYFHCLIDPFSSFGFGLLHIGRSFQGAVAILESKVIPRFREWDIRIDTIFTDNRNTYQCGYFNINYFKPKKAPIYYRYFLHLSRIKSKQESRYKNIFLESFKGIFRDEFVKKIFRGKNYESTDEMQADLDRWLKYYNNERPIGGYLYKGKSPIEPIKQFMSNPD